MEIWLVEFGIFQEVEKLADEVGAHNFTNFHDTIVGKTLIHSADFWGRFSKFLVSNKYVAAIWTKSGCDRIFFENNLATSLGIRLKQTKWWSDHLDEMEKAKRQLKKVRKVMES